jgi:muramoyltetrapeptide carboxypeptidase
VEAPLHARLNLVIQHLRDQGFVVEEGQCLRDQAHSASASASARAAELMHFMQRDDVHAIIPPWGGELAVQLLDRLDWPALQTAQPKWLLGYSDTSTWLLPVTLKLGWATAHGPCLMDLAPGQADPLTSRVMTHLGTAHGASFMQQQSAAWQLKWTDFADVPTTTYQLTEPTLWRELHGATQAQCRGRLIGGCVDTLVHIAATPFGDVRQFIATHAHEGTLLYLENAEQSPTALVRALHQLRWAGWLDGLAGLLIGRSAAPDSTRATELRYADALQDTLADLACPVLLDVDIGHRPPQLLLINGARADVHWRATAGGHITQTLA